MNLSVYFVTPHDPDDGLVLSALQGGATLIQLRDKYASDEVMIEKARRLGALAAEFGVPLVINDRLEVALVADAAGLHIGQSDGDPSVIRDRLGKDKILGLSIENEIQLEEMKKLPPGVIDYIGIGPVRDTATKPDAAPATGFDGFARIVEQSPVPTVAIGGIGAADIPTLKATGCDGIAVVTAISEADNPEEATRNLVNIWKGEQ